MTWFEDLTPYTYGGIDATVAPTLNVGWLARDHAYSTGSVPGEFVTRLREVCEHAQTRQTRGLHACELCTDEIAWDDYTRQSSAEIRAVGADGTRYAAPRLILHYVTAHRYAPPPSFIAAVLRAQALSWEDAQAKDLCLSCGGALDELSRERGAYVRGPAREPITVAWFSCKACASDYTRAYPEAR